jgi:Rrf2 family cysteine metabolism transcriptional repressor
MFTISAKGIYGLTAMLELATHHEHVQIKDIAEKHDIPQHYLEQILVILKKGGLVESFRGAQGGYALSRSPDGIKVIDILTLLEGKLEIVADQRKGGSLDFFWTDLAKAITGALSETLGDLLFAKQRHEQQFIYTI